MIFSFYFTGQLQFITAVLIFIFKVKIIINNINKNVTTIITQFDWIPFGESHVNAMKDFQVCDIFDYMTKRFCLRALFPMCVVNHVCVPSQRGKLRQSPHWDHEPLQPPTIKVRW